MKWFGRTLIALVCLLAVVSWWWYSWDLNEPHVVSRIYIAKSQGECNKIELEPDYTFKQELWHGDLYAEQAQGTWRRFGRGGVAFSDNFLGATSAATSTYNVYGMIDNTFGFHSIVVDSQMRPTIFHQRYVLRSCAL